ncbi:MAG: dTMP kinase, partial [Pseudomonadota bacterium]
RLAEHLRSGGQGVVLTREPGGSPGAEELRSLLVEGEPDRWSPETEILLFTAARRDHMERTILPALADGRTVICDRFVDSTRAYQGSGPNREQVEVLHQLMIARDPDLTLLIDIEPAEAARRAFERAGGEDRFERHGLDFQHRLRAAFHMIAKAETDRVRVIDGRGTSDDVTARVLAAYREHANV